MLQVPGQVEAAQLEYIVQVEVQELEVPDRQLAGALALA